MYSKSLVAHRGTDNRFLIEFVNQDQKRVDLRRTAPGAVVSAGAFVVGTEYEIITVGTTDFTLIGAADNAVGTIFTATSAGTGTGTATTIVYTELQFTCRLISHNGEKLLLEKPLVIVNATAGQAKLVLTEQELDLIAPGKVGWSVEQTLTGELYEPVYVNDNAGGRGVMNVVDSIMPAFVKSEVLTIPSPYGQTAWPQAFSSSTLNTDDTDYHTFQFGMTQFTGDILTEGAADTDGNWYTIQTDTIIEDDLAAVSINGFHPYIRFTFTFATDIAAGLFTIGNEYAIVTPGDTDFTLLGATDSNPGTVFTATAIGVGTGTAAPASFGTVDSIQHR